jgi:GDP-L-fucose synthase
MLHDGPPHYSNFGYAYAKRILDIANKAFRDQHGCNFTSVIPTNIYGPNDNFSEGCHFIPSIIKRVSTAQKSGSLQIVVPGSGRALRQFIYSRDLARLIVWVLRNYNSSEPIILSVDESNEVSIKDVVHLVCEISGFRGEIQWDTSQTDGQLKKTADSSLLYSLLSDFEFTKLEHGMSQDICVLTGSFVQFILI